MNNQQKINNLHVTMHAAIEAGKAILDIYETDFEVDYKADESPLTMADQAAHKIILEHLEQTGIPVLSEEGKHLPYDERRNWDKLWIVDPLDGTKEFVKRNGEFTVNIALVENNQPRMGVIFCPTLKILYFADDEAGGAFKAVLKDTWRKDTIEIGYIINHADKMPLDEPREKFVVVASRSHLNDETRSFVDNIKKQVGEIDFVSRGSSLKLCMVAEGKADIYPRFAPTSEWDTAAGQAIVEHSGGKVILPASRQPVIYNKEDILNPWFLVVGKGTENKIKI